MAVHLVRPQQSHAPVPWDSVSVSGLLVGGCLAVGPFFIPEPTRDVLQASTEGFSLNVRKYILINDRARS